MKTHNSSFKSLPFISVLIGVIVLVSIIPVSAYDEITVFTNQKTYFLRDTVEIRGDIFSISNEDLIKIRIINPQNSTVFEIDEKIDREKRDYEYKFTLLEQSLTKGIYTVNVIYDQKQATTTFRLFPSQIDEELLESSISFGKDVYSWTDTVEIFVDAPSYNRNNQVEYIGLGSELEGKIEIQTGMGKLENYRLIETSHDSGIFHGKITLSGDSTIDVNGNDRKDDASGILLNNYPFDGKIPARNNDLIKVTFSNANQKVENSSLIKWTTAKMGWVKKGESTISLLRVLDKDMDLSPERKDFVLIYDPSDRTFGRTTLLETGISTGVFEGHTSIPYPIYFDRTIPNSKSSSDFLEITRGEVFDESKESIEEKIEPLEKTKKIKKIPDWVRDNAKWWWHDKITDSDFTSGIQFLIKEGIIQIPETTQGTTDVTQNIPSWIKNNADWWSQGLISDDDFVKGIQFLVENGIIAV
jgi:hypothetical protein